MHMVKHVNILTWWYQNSFNFEHQFEMLVVQILGLFFHKKRCFGDNYCNLPYSAKTFCCFMFVAIISLASCCTHAKNFVPFTKAV